MLFVNMVTPRKIKYLCLWSRRINTQFLYHGKKKAIASLMHVYGGISYFSKVSSGELRAAQEAARQRLEGREQQALKTEASLVNTSNT